MVWLLQPTLGTCNVPAVWPDLAKFPQFGQFLKVKLVLDKIWTHFGKFLML